MRPVPRIALNVVTRESVAPGPVGTFHPFRDTPELRGAFIVGVEYLTYAELLQLPSGQANSGAVNALLLTLCDEQGEVIHNVPVASIYTTRQLGIFKQLHPFRCVWERSGVTFAGTVGALYEAAAFMFHYYRPEDVPRDWPLNFDHP